MHRSHFLRPVPWRALCASALFAAAACQGGPSAPDAASLTSDGAAGSAEDSDATPTFLTPAAGAPSIANPVVSFWAKVGRDSEVFMYYAASPGQRDSTEFLRFRVRKRSLAYKPDGSPFAPGDSIRITLAVVDAATLEVDFQPSGLVFSRTNPADLKLSYLEADHDFNHDGVIDQVDARIERRLAVWKRENAQSPWLKQSTVVAIGLDEVEAKVYGFTSYAIAW